MDIVEYLLRIAVGMGLAAVLGLEREASGKAAGLRTYALVGLGSAVFTVVGMEAFAPADRSRVAAQIVSGIGFLGAGAIFRSGPLIKGLTTAAGLWAAAAVGMTAGAGELLWGAVATLLAILVLGGLRTLEPVVARLRRAVTLEAVVTPTSAFIEVRDRISEMDPDVDLTDVRLEDDAVHMRFSVDRHDVGMMRSALQALDPVTATRVVP